jgi:hypothetical protein
MSPEQLLVMCLLPHHLRKDLDSRTEKDPRKEELEDREAVSPETSTHFCIKPDP